MTDPRAEALFGANPEAAPEIRTPADVDRDVATKLYGGEPEAKPRDWLDDLARETKETDPEAAEPADGDADPDKPADTDKPAEGGDDPLAGLDLDPEYEVVGALREAATELGIDAAGMEKLAEVELQHREEYWSKTSDAWVAELQAEPDFLGKCERARSVVRQFGDDGLVESLSVYGNHPGLIRMLARIGRELEDRS